MRNSIIILLLLITQFTFAQGSRLKLTPYFGLGLKLPDPQQLVSGPYQVTQQFQWYQVGTLFDINGQETNYYSTTNRLGVNLGFDLTDNLEVHVGGNRMNLITSYKVPFQYNYKGSNVDHLVDKYVVFNASAGVKYTFANKTWVTFDGQFAPNYGGFNTKLTGNPIKPGGPWVNDTGDGLSYPASETPVSLGSVYFGVGKKILLDLNVELGISLGIGTVGTYNVTYFENRKAVGQSKIDEKYSGIFLTVKQPINLGFKFKEKTPKPPKEPKAPKEPKVKTPKPDPKAKESYEFKDKVIFKGEDIVLDNIKFLQSKSDLLAPGMKELDAVYELLKKYPDTKVSLTGHTSTEGNRKDNINLSEDRAEACKAYLVSKGIKSSRVKAYGVGPDKPISSTNPELNRRVEIKVF